jgi:hypothetical protein
MAATHLWVKGGDDEHGWVALIICLRPQQLSHGGAVLWVQRCINLIKQVEGRRVAALDGKYQGQCHQCLLAARQQLQGDCLIAFAKSHPHLRQATHGLQQPGFIKLNLVLPTKQ